MTMNLQKQFEQVKQKTQYLQNKQEQKKLYKYKLNIKNILYRNKNKPFIYKSLSKFISIKSSGIKKGKKDIVSKQLDMTKLLGKMNILRENNKSMFEYQYDNLLFFKNQKNKFIKHFLPFNKQWKNSVYLYDKKNLSLNSIKHHSTNNFIKSFFNLVPSLTKKIKKSKRMRDYLRRSNINNIYISNTEIKQTNDKLNVTLYMFDRNKQHFIKKLYFSNKNIKNILFYKGLKHNNINLNIINKKNKQLNIKLDKNIKQKINRKLKGKNLFLYRKLYINNIYKMNRNKSTYIKKVNLSLKNNKSSLRKNNKYLLRKRKIMIRKNFKHFTFNLINFYIVKKNLLKTFNNNYYPEFLNFLMKYFNMNFSIERNKIIFNWPKEYNISTYKYNVSKKNNSFNLFFLTNYIEQTLSKFNIFLNIFPSEKTNKLILFFNNDTNKLVPLFNNTIHDIEYNKAKKINFIFLYLIIKTINLNFINLYGKNFAIKYINILWKNAFNLYYNNTLKNNIQEQITNINKVIYDKDIFFSTRNKYISVLKNILENIYNKKSLLNIVNIKYLYLNSDNYIEAIKKKLKKRTGKLLKVMRKSLKMIRLPKNMNFSKLLSKSIFTKFVFNKNLSKEIINNIKYKYVTGVRLEAKGRLTKRYTASRSVFKFRYKGNLKNLEYSKKYPNDLKRTPNLHLIRGIIKPNIQHSSTNGTRRIGVFGLKGWISGN